MKVLSLTQPWASLILAGLKKIETRSWGTAYRGPLLIHASKGFPADCRELLGFWRENYTDIRHQLGPASDLPLGQVIAKCTLIDCYRITDKNAPTFPSYEHMLGDYPPGRYGWALADVEPVTPPIAAKGRLGLWNYDLEGAA